MKKVCVTVALATSALCSCGGGGNGATGSCVVPATVASNLTLDTSCKVWHVQSGGTSVAGSGSAAPVLTIDPGVTVAFAQNAYLQVGVDGPGSIHAVGTSAAPIAFAADAPSPSPGYWGAVYLADQAQATSTIAFATFDSAGGAQNTAGPASEAGSLVVNSDTSVYTVLLHDLTFTHNGANGLVMDGFNVGFAAGSGNLTVDDWGTGSQPFVVAANQAVTLPATLEVPAGKGGMVDLVDGAGDHSGFGGTGAWVMQSGTWPSIHLPYLVDGLVPGAGAGACIEGPGTGTPVTLTIASPNTLEFNNGGELDVDCRTNGTADLVAQGPLTFTSAGASAPGSWSGIHFFVTASGLQHSSLTNATVENAGGTLTTCNPPVYGAIFVDSSSTIGNPAVPGPTITGCTIQNYPGTGSGIITANISNSASYGPPANTFTPANGSFPPVTGC